MTIEEDVFAYKVKNEDKLSRPVFSKQRAAMKRLMI